MSPAVTGPTALAPRSLNGSGHSWLQGCLPCRWAPRPRPRLLRPQDLPLLCAQSAEREVRDSTETRARRCHIRLRVPGLVRAGQVVPHSREPGGGGLLGTEPSAGPQFLRTACTGEGGRQLASVNCLLSLIQFKHFCICSSLLSLGSHPVVQYIWSLFLTISQEMVVSSVIHSEAP